MAKSMWLVWVKEREDRVWKPNGDGPMTEREATRVAKDLRKMGWPSEALPCGVEPVVKES